MGLLQEKWLETIQEKLFEGNTFLNYCQDHSAFVRNNQTVHIPVAGPEDGISINRPFNPSGMTASARLDTEVTYSLDKYSTPMRAIDDLDAYAVSYDLRNSIINGQMRMLNDVMAKNIAAKWAVNASVTFTSGASVSHNAPGASGTRKKFVLEDLQNLRIKMDNDLIPDDGNRYLMLDPYLYTELTSDPAIQEYMKFGQSTLPTGVVGEVLGFNLIKKPTVLVATATASALRSFSATGTITGVQSTDSLAALAWHSEFVSKAIGDISVYLRETDPQYQAHLISARFKVGSSKLRSDIGTYLVVQGS